MSQATHQTPARPMQTAETVSSTAGRRKRLSQIMPELRQRIPGLFDRDVPAERIAETFSVAKADVLEDLIRDTRRLVLRRPPAESRLFVAARRSAA